MKCPYSGEKDARVIPAMVCPERLIHSAFNCRNPECTACDLLTCGFPPRMDAETKTAFGKVIRAVRDESGFDLIHYTYPRT